MRTNDARIGIFLGAAAVALIPWTVVLADTLPDEIRVRNWALAWIGLDLLLTLGCIGTAVLLHHGDERYRVTAAATAAAALLDCWFDLTTASPGTQFTQAVAAAVGELSLAGVCCHVALRSRAGTD
ncbi:hypothetical protein [Nocardia sp. NPDC051570]|uniref:hypothetical protein n=1 Tax=Nocardia sp. NPDC051570 TaxID=3364324 RepID=UPI0037B18BD5